MDKNIRDIIENFVVEKTKEYKQQNAKNIYENVKKEINDKFGIDMTSEGIRSMVRSFRAKNNLDEHFEPIKEVVGANETLVKTTRFGSNDTITVNNEFELDKDIVITPEILLRKNGFNPNKFILTNGRVSEREVNTKQGIKKLCSSTVSVKPKNRYVFDEENIKNLFDSIKEPNWKPIPKVEHELGEDILVVPIADIHLNLIANKSNVGEEYNLEIAKNIFYNAIYDLIQRVKDKSFSRIIFPFGNDGLNSDINHMTTKGTKQDDDVDYETAVIEYTNMIVWAVEELKQLAPVELILIPSNHDKNTMFGIANALRLLYKEDTSVFFDITTLPRKYIKCGNTLIMISHDCKPDTVNGIIQYEARDLISQTDNTLVLLAHLHHESVLDKQGTDIRRLPTLSGRSYWSAEQGYCSRRKAQAFIINSKYGLTNILYMYPQEK